MLITDRGRGCLPHHLMLPPSPPYKLKTQLNFALSLDPFKIIKHLSSPAAAPAQLPSFRGLARLKGVAVRLRLFGGRRGRSNNNKKKKGKKKTKAIVKNKFMELWQKMIFPVRRVWVAVSSRVKARKNGAGLLKLHDDVQTCEYQDVQVMWEMLNRSETELTSHNPKRRQRPFWRVFVWSNHSSASSLTAKHA